MTIPKISTSFITVVFSLFFLVQPALSENIGEAPFPLQAALFLKLLAFDKNISSGGSVTIHVVDAPEFAAEMKKAEGKPIGSAKLEKVTAGDNLPSEKPSVIYIGSSGKLSDVLKYTKENKVISITGNPDLVSKDVTLAVGTSGGKPKIMLNLSSTKDEGIEWNPAILKVAATIK